MAVLRMRGPSENVLICRDVRCHANARAGRSARGSRPSFGDHARMDDSDGLGASRDDVLRADDGGIRPPVCGNRHGGKPTPCFQDEH